MQHCRLSILKGRSRPHASFWLLHLFLHLALMKLQQNVSTFDAKCPLQFNNHCSLCPPSATIAVNGQIMFLLDSSYSSDLNVSRSILPRDADLCSAIQTSRQNFTSSWQCVLCFGMDEPQRQGHDVQLDHSHTHTQNTAGTSQLYPNLESSIYIVI